MLAKVKFKYFLIVFSVFSYFALFVLEYLFTLVFDAWWWDKGFPLVYESTVCSGFNYTNCQTEFYWSGLIINVFWPVVILFMAYRTGIKYEKVKVKNKFIIFNIFMITEAFLTTIIWLSPLIVSKLEEILSKLFVTG